MKAKKISKALMVLKKHCNNNYCEDCKFSDKNLDCALNHVPIDWNIGKVKKILKDIERKQGGIDE